MNKIITFIFLFFPLNLSFCEDYLSKIFTAEEINKVTAGEIISRMYMKDNPYLLNTHLQIIPPKTSYTAENFSIYEMIVDEKAFLPYVLTEQSKLELYRTLTQFSRLKGMQYYSRRIGKIQELMVNCYTVASPANQKQIPDKVYQSFENKIINYYVQQDNKLGKLLYKSELYNEGDDFILINTVMQDIFPVCSKGENKIISFFIYNKEKGGYFYYALNVSRVKVALIREKINSTFFSNRLRGGTVHFAKLLGFDWSDKIQAWDEKKLSKGKYRTY